ncbi:30S ribosomal protein S20 [Candidatus Poriferisocius sp.]|uniref:30S ribosomal protein S20 n=1 Tax=Candidatus Poriferisocius sp. TaxID=3101276 RepID=UPI003B0132B1
MANIKSQIKRNRQNVKRRERNQAVRSEINTRTRTAVAAATDGNAAEAAEAARMAIKRIDKAAGKGILHPNTAARRKSRLMKRLSRLQAG